MGWTSTDARFYTADGKVNRKAECDALYTWEGEKTKNEVIKSSMRGSVYYAAVRTTDKTTGHSEVFAAVCLTSTRREEARERYGLFTYQQWYHLLTSGTDATREPTQSPETPQTVECIGESRKIAQTA